MTFGGVEALLVGFLSQQFPGVRCLTELPDDLANAAPVVQIVQVGGPADDDLPSFIMPTISVDAFASDRLSSTTLAQQVHDALRNRLVGHVLTGGVVTKVRTVSGASWRPWDDTAVRRFGATYQLYIRTQ